MSDRELPLHLFAKPAETPENVADAWFSRLDLQGVELIFVYGVSPAAHAAARAWLHADPSRQLHFIEDDPARLCSFDDTQVAVHLIGEPDSNDGLLQLAVHPLAALNHIVTSTSRNCERLERAIGILSHASRIALNQSLHGHTHANLRHLPGSFHGSALFGKFKGIPAIIVGAGPSLEKQLPLLAELGDRALIIAGGSAFTALTRAGLEPHFAAALAPAPDEIDRVWQAGGYETPLFWRFRLHPDALALVHGPRLYQSHPRGTGLESEIEEALGIPPGPQLNEGSTIPYLTALVHQLGCDPISYIGLDLALTDSKPYADGITHRPPPDEERVAAEDIHGQPVDTYWKWLSERHSLGNLIGDLQPTTFVNCTEGGLSIEGVPNLTLQEVADRHLTRQRDLRGLVHAAIAAAPLPQFDNLLEELL